VCFYKNIKDSSTKSFKKTIKGLFKRQGVNNKNIKTKDIKAVLKHKDKISYNNIIIKVKGFIKG
jgi:hypothetical protein